MGLEKKFTSERFPLIVYVRKAKYQLLQARKGYSNKFRCLLLKLADAQQTSRTPLLLSLLLSGRCVLWL